MHAEQLLLCNSQMHSIRKKLSLNNHAKTCVLFLNHMSVLIIRAEIPLRRINSIISFWMYVTLKRFLPRSSSPSSFSYSSSMLTSGDSIHGMFLSNIKLKWRKPFWNTHFFFALTLVLSVKCFLSLALPFLFILIPPRPLICSHMCIITQRQLWFWKPWGSYSSGPPVAQKTAKVKLS